MEVGLTDIFDALNRVNVKLHGWRNEVIQNLYYNFPPLFTVFTASWNAINTVVQYLWYTFHSDVYRLLCRLYYCSFDWICGLTTWPKYLTRFLFIFVNNLVSIFNPSIIDLLLGCAARGILSIFRYISISN